MVKEPVTGAEFPVVQHYWVPNASFRCLGAGPRVKKILLLKVKVYAVALYVEPALAARELGVRYRGGFFETDDDYCQAIIDGAFGKVLALRLARDIEGQQFTEAINENVVPRLKITGGMEALEKFQQFFLARKLTQGSEVLLLWRVQGLEAVLEVAVAPPGGDPHHPGLQPQLTIASPQLCRALFEVFLGASSKVPEAKAAWAKGARELLESEQVRRGDRKGGAG